MKPPIRIDKLPPIEIPKPRHDLCVLVVAPNEKPQKELVITGDRIKHYAERCAADLLIIDSLPNVGHPCAYKHVLGQVAKHYKQTLMLDTDIIVQDHCPSVFDAVPAGLWGMTDDLPQIRACGASGWMDSEWQQLCKALGQQLPLTSTWNSGLCVAPSDADREYYAPPVDVPDVWCIEQHLLTHALLRDTSRVHTLPQVWQAGYPWRDFLTSLENSYTIHMNGCRHHPTRLALLEHFNKSTGPIPSEIMDTIRKADWAPWWTIKKRPEPPKKIKPRVVKGDVKPCECPLAGWCERHAIEKHEAWHRLCQTNHGYRRAWDEGKGPGQPKQDNRKERNEIRKSKPPGVGACLKERISNLLKVSDGGSCGCSTLANQMDKWGPDGCDERREYIVGRLMENKEMLAESISALGSAATAALGWTIGTGIADPVLRLGANKFLTDSIKQARDNLEASKRSS